MKKKQFSKNLKQFQNTRKSNGEKEKSSPDNELNEAVFLRSTCHLIENHRIQLNQKKKRNCILYRFKKIIKTL